MEKESHIFSHYIGPSYWLLFRIGIYYSINFRFQTYGEIYVLSKHEAESKMVLYPFT